MSLEKRVEIHQTVHGYRDGHELLGASLQLPGASRRTMLGLSDLSGDGLARGFEEYLTGYPLDEAGLYVFARTWYAGEMPRPGCVWTHSLLLKQEEMESLGDPGLLRAYFRRPELGQIGATLPAITHAEQNGTIPAAQLDAAAYELLTRLFGDDAPVLIFGEHSEQYEATCLQLWSQQWPGLRRRFAFCTGSLEPRTIDKRSFDVQVVPTQRQRRVLRGGLRYSVVTDADIARALGPAALLSASTSTQVPVDEPMLQLPVEPGEALSHARDGLGQVEYWREVLFQDLGRRNDLMREFVLEYTSDVPASRVVHRKVLECWLLLERLDAVSTSLRDLTGVLVRAFPSAQEARKLKRAILGSNSLIRGREVELVQELLTLPSISALDLQDLDVHSRAMHLFRGEGRWRVDKIAWLLKSSQLNECGRSLALSIVEDLGAEELAKLFAEDSELFATILRRKPALATQEILWRQPRELQRAVVRVLGTQPLGTSLQEVMSSIVGADAAALVPEIVAELGTAVVPQLLDGLDATKRSRGDVDEWKWAEQLRGYDVEILGWLAGCQAPLSWTLAFAVALVGPYNKHLGDTAGENFVRHLRDRDGHSPDTAFVDFAAFCLAIALRNFSSDAGVVAAQAFHFVHSSALRSGLSRRAWQWLGPQVPRPGYFSLEGWDDGEKLRRALIQAFLTHGWRPQLLAEAVRDVQTRRWVERFCREFEAGRELLREAAL